MAEDSIRDTLNSYQLTRDYECAERIIKEILNKAQPRYCEDKLVGLEVDDITIVRVMSMLREYSTVINVASDDDEWFRQKGLE